MSLTNGWKLIVRIQKIIINNSNNGRKKNDLSVSGSHERDGRGTEIRQGGF